MTSIVDPLAETVTVHARPTRRSRTSSSGEVADAEPAVPGWRMKVNDIFAG
jgi:hypothetical protein